MGGGGGMPGVKVGVGVGVGPGMPGVEVGVGVSVGPGMPGVDVGLGVKVGVGVLVDEVYVLDQLIGSVSPKFPPTITRSRMLILPSSLRSPARRIVVPILMPDSPQATTVSAARWWMKSAVSVWGSASGKTREK